MRERTTRGKTFQAGGAASAKLLRKGMSEVCEETRMTRPIGGIKDGKSSNRKGHGFERNEGGLRLRRLYITINVLYWLLSSVSRNELPFLRTLFDLFTYN